MILMAIKLKSSNTGFTRIKNFFNKTKFDGLCLTTVPVPNLRLSNAFEATVGKDSDCKRLEKTYTFCIDLDTSIRYGLLMALNHESGFKEVCGDLLAELKTDYGSFVTYSEMSGTSLDDLILKLEKIIK